MRTTNYISSVREPFQEPEDDAVLWRYMDFAKYVSLLSSKALWFSSAAAFADPYEGAVGILENELKHRAVVEAAAAQHELDLVRREQVKLGVSGTSVDEATAATRAKEFMEEWTHANLLERQRTYVNCWYENNVESLAMWQLYAKDTNNAIAIKTTVEKLKAALTQEQTFEIGRINYIDYADAFKHFVSRHRFWFKSNHFEHEKEVRLMPVMDLAFYKKMGIEIKDSSTPPKGINIAVDCASLIEEVYVSPWAAPWLTKLVTEINALYGLPQLSVQQSFIAKQPAY